MDTPWYAEDEDREWRDRAACKGKNPDVWHAWAEGSVNRAATELARRASQYALDVCAGCPVRQPCLDFAIRNGVLDGVWGGLMPVDRRKLQRVGA